MADIPRYRVRPMLREEIPAVLDLWRETHLSEGTYSIDTWFEHDPDGFYVAVTDDDEVIGACAGVLQNPDLAFVGLYVVKSVYQRKGIGRKIWNAVMERVGERNAGVNPVPDQLSNYRDKSGFPVQTSWYTIVGELPKPDLSKFNDEVPGIEISKVLPDDNEAIAAISEYDADVYGFSRGNLVPLLCRERESVTVAAYNSDSNEICGFGCIRHNIKGNALVGPLLADHEEVAEGVLRELIKSLPIAEEGVCMMTIDCNKPAVELLEKVGFENQPGLARLYRKEEIDVKYDKVFGQSNLNFSIF